MGFIGSMELRDHIHGGHGTCGSVLFPFQSIGSMELRDRCQSIGAMEHVDHDSWVSWNLGIGCSRAIYRFYRT
jgi:hypothetical protein